MYKCFLGGIELPTPAKLTVKIKGQNQTMTLLNGTEINILKSPGLSQISLPLVLPMLGGDKTPDCYLSLLEKLKTQKKPTRFVMTRAMPNGHILFDTNMKVSVEDYTITEDAKNGPDVSVNVSMKQFNDYGTRVLNVVKLSDGSSSAESGENGREADNAPSAGTYTVKSGDCLWLIAKKFYGNGAKYTKIFDANRDKIKNPNRIFVGQVLTIPK